MKYKKELLYTLDVIENRGAQWDFDLDNWRSCVTGWFILLHPHLKLKDDRDAPHTFWGPGYVPVFEDHCNYTAVSKFFDIPLRSGEKIFGRAPRSIERIRENIKKISAQKTCKPKKKGKKNVRRR